MESNCILNVCIGDSVLTIERHPNYPNGIWKWESRVVAVENNYIETTYERPRDLDWLKELVKNLDPLHRTFERTWIKNYYAPDGTINVELP